MKKILFLICIMFVISTLQSESVMSYPIEPYKLIQTIDFSSPDPNTMHKVELFDAVNDFPRAIILKIDGKIIDRKGYATSKIMIGDVTADNQDEIFFYQYGTGSAGEMGLNVYSVVNANWKQIFTDPRITTLQDYERFKSEYLEGKSLRFYDKITGMTGILDMTGFLFSEEQLQKMKFQLDPIAEYVIHNENIGCIIETVQWNFAFSHPISVFTLHNFYLYQFDKKEFTLYESKILDEKGAILSAKKYL
ncbi:hypothetical protein QFZ81_002942 [Paenibacillus sp. V4I9]|uniref:hypothetical protein n=1 Tax=Paenibacillus sp. V4I9 TaxID=3042308 RepID=UPI00277D8CC2|nr:hypothetical protein [Paenibacillus sp. V4I9]MDQ0887854.1 hypothetical protein [Paenibacillus sp. V4I9]